MAVLAVAIGFALGLAGCAGAPPRAKGPALDPPARFAAGAPSEAARPTGPVLDPTAWLDALGAEALRGLVAEARVSNPGLRAARARLAVAGAQATLEGAPRLPTLDLAFTASRTKRNSATGLAVISTVNNNFDLSLETRWELDVWGRLRNEARAAVAEAQASRGDLRAAELTVAANVAQAWFDLHTAERQLALAQRTVASFAASRRVVEGRVRRGLDTALDLRLARSDLAGAEARAASRAASLTVARRRLEVLLGRYPRAEVATEDPFAAPTRDRPRSADAQPPAGAADIGEPPPEPPTAARRTDGGGGDGGAVPEAPPVATASALPALEPVPAGLPADLLLRRPDLQAAERRLAAAQERLQASRKARYLPSIVLTASGGQSSAELADLLDPDFLIWQLVGSITEPIFDGRRRGARVRQDRARLEEAVADYADAVLTAFEEVENALAREQTLAAEVASRRVAAKEARAARRLARAEYQRGLTDIITLLSSQRRAFDADEALVERQNARFQNRIDLHRALGGGFDAPPAPRTLGSTKTP
jgi:outer membrane protein TolC